jgi:Domain of unknown function (DUF4118)
MRSDNSVEFDSITKCIVTINAVGIALCLCEFGMQYGVGRGLGAIVWLPVLGVAYVFGWRFGLFAAALAVTGFFYVCVEPYHALTLSAADLTAEAALTFSMAFAVFVVAHRQRPQVALGALAVVFWRELPTDDFMADCGRGEMRAERFCVTLLSEKDTAVLGLMVRDMIHAGRYDGPVIGFFDHLSRLFIHRAAPVIALGAPRQNADDNADDADRKVRVIGT